MAAITNLYTMQEASKHNTKHDCWIVVNGKVYDVTKYLDDHPAGDEVILEVTGKDATDDFEDVGHSEDARETMKQYYIGDLDTTAPISVKKTPISTKGSFSTNQYWAVSIAVVGISVTIGFLYLRKK